MSTEGWYCFKCKKVAEITRIEMEYLGYKFRLDVLQCPNCKATFVTEDLAKKIIEAEDVIEKKAK